MNIDLSLSFNTSIILFILIAMGIVFFLLRFREKKVEESINHANKAKSVDENNSTDDTAEKNRIFLIIVGLVIAFVVFLLYFVFDNKKLDSEGSFSMIPIWAAVFIPIVANQKKQKKDKPNQKQQEIRKFVVIFLLGFVLAIAMAVLYFVK